MKRTYALLIVSILLVVMAVACQPIQSQQQQEEAMAEKVNEMKGRSFEYQVGDYHLHITFLEEDQLRWEYLAAPDGLTGKTATEEIERVQLRANQFLMMWKEADGTQVVDVLDLGQMKMYANFVLANGDRFSAQAELVAVQ